MQTSLLTSLLLTLSSAALAEPPHSHWNAHNGETQGESRAHEFDIDGAAGVSRHNLDGFTRVTGWRLGNSWYFGKQKGGVGGLALVWQGNRDQMSLSTKGFRLTRRF